MTLISFHWSIKLFRKIMNTTPFKALLILSFSFSSNAALANCEQIIANCSIHEYSSNYVDKTIKSSPCKISICESSTYAFSGWDFKDGTSVSIKPLPNYEYLINNQKAYAVGDGAADYICFSTYKKPNRQYCTDYKDFSF